MMRLVLLILTLGIILMPSVNHAAPSLQLFVELTPEGGTLKPPPGIYSGPLEINKAITLDGGDEVTLDGEGAGSILIIKADGVTVRGMHMTRSGRSHDQVDAGILIEANDGLFENNVIDDSLFGIHLRQANGNTVRNNLISSIDETPSLRGDGIRLWYSHENRIEGNHIHHSRDLVFANSRDNHVVRNTIKDSRIGMEFVFSPDNTIEDNRIEYNDTGIIVLYSSGLKIRANYLSHMRNVSSSAFAIKESSGVMIEGNEILHCAIGVVANSPTDPGNTIQLQNNHFAYNDVAMYFYGEKGGHTINNNRFENNIMQVVVSASSSAMGHHWHDNYWDTYYGFDENNDGIGDTPYEMYIYADRLWMDRPMIKFFRGTLLLGLVDFIERLTPFSSPKLILRDPSPHVKPASAR